MKLTPELNRMLVEALEQNRHLKDQIELVLDEVEPLQTQRLMEASRGVNCLLSSLHSRVCGNPAPKVGP